MEKNKEIELKRYDIDKPVEVVKVANVLKNHIVKHKLYTAIQGKNYAHVEGWQFAGFLLGTFAKIETVESLSNNSEIKWKANASIYRDDKVIATGFSLCSDKEQKAGKKVRTDEYAVLSMAQTRAIGKAYRNSIGWVMKLAGYEGTPKEEMQKFGDKDPLMASEAKDGPDGEKVFICSKCDEIVDEQVAGFSKKMFGKILCREDQKTAKRK